MAREEKVWEYAIEAGYTPLEDRCIIVKGAAERQDRPILQCVRCGRPSDVRERAHLASLRPLLGNPRKRCFPCRSLFGDRIGEACQRPAQRDH